MCPRQRSRKCRGSRGTVRWQGQCDSQERSSCRRCFLRDDAGGTCQAGKAIFLCQRRNDRAHAHFQLSTFRSGLARTITEKRKCCIEGLPSISRPRKPREVYASYDLDGFHLRFQELQEFFCVLEHWRRNQVWKPSVSRTNISGHFDQWSNCQHPRWRDDVLASRTR